MRRHNAPGALSNQTGSKSRPSGHARVRAALHGEPDLGPDASDRERLLASLPYLARQLVRAEYGALTVMNEEGRITSMYVSGLSQHQAETIGDPPAGRGVPGLMGPGGVPLRLHEIEDHPRSVGFPEGHPPMHALLGVAVEHDERHAANLYVANAPGRASFSAEEQELLESLAKYGTTALEINRLYQRETELRRRAELAEREVETIIRASAAAVLVVEAGSGDVLMATDETRRILGMPIVRGATRTDYEGAVRYLQPDGSEHPAEELPLQKALRTGASQGPAEVIFARSDGRRIPTLVSAAPVFDEWGELQAAIAVFQDTTQLKELEQAKSDFLSTISHDLRNPVATVKALSELVTEEMPLEAQEYRDAVNRQCDEIESLVSNLLDMSRIEAGAYPVDPEECYLVDVVEDATRRAQSTNLGTDRAIETEVPRDLPPLFVDAKQLGRVLDNLLSNALKYSERDVAVQAELSPDGDQVITWVIDQGPDIPEEDRPHIFDRFYRGGGQRSHGSGTGLGLAICRAIIEAHHGEIGIKNANPKQGAAFWFTLPLEIPQE